jgi:autophagy-related protein 2
MILSLKPVEMANLTGWGSVMNELSGRWLEDICSTQAHKFVTRASPFQPISNLRDPLAELAMVLIVPEGSPSDYFRGVVGGTTVFAGQVLLEALSTSAKLTRFAANQLNRQTVSATSPGTNGSSSSTSSSSSSSLHPPRRPRRIPRSALDTTSHAYESILHGLSTANYKIITVPLREYQIHGATGAARSALRGIPVGVLCPIAGTSEAISYTLLGLRNQLRPDIWKEEEANLRGLDFD